MTLDFDVSDISSNSKKYPLTFGLDILAETESGVTFTKTYLIYLWDFFEVVPDRLFNSVP
jgi:hypothetical protein